MNLGEFRLAISSVLSLDNTNGSAEQLLIDRAVNRGVLDVLRKTRCYVADADLTFTAGVWDYQMPTSVLETVTVFVETEGEVYYPPLQRKTSAEILRMHGTGAVPSGIPKYFALEGWDLILLAPTPTTDVNLGIYYVPRPQALTGTSDDPSVVLYGGIPDDYHDAIELFALSRLADYDDDQSSGSGERYRQVYQQRYREIRREVKRMGTAKLAPFAIPNTSR